MASDYNLTLAMAAGLSLIAALLHVGVIIGGPFALAGTGRSKRFIAISSAICLVYGLVHLTGLIHVWGALS